MVIVLTILIFVFTCLTSFYIALAIQNRNLVFDISKTFNKSLEKKKIQLRLNKYSKTISIKMTIRDKVEINLIQKSNIRKYIPFASFNELIMFEVLIFSIVLYKIMLVVQFLPSAVCIATAASFIPILILDLMSKYNSEKIRHKLAEFISILNRWCAVKEDIVYAFEKSLDSGIDQTLKIYVRDMLIQVNGGISPIQALNMLDYKVDNPQFHDFITNIKQNMRHRGNIRLLLTNMETQFYKMEEEYNRRNISTYRDRLILYGIMIFVLLSGYALFRLNPKAYEYYIYTIQGKSLLTIFCIIYAFGAYIAFSITKFDY